MDDDRWLEQLAGKVDVDTADARRAPARLKARIYSALVSHLSETGPLLSLADTKAAGNGLCVFEEAIALLPVGERIGSMNPCRVCHARVLAERVDHAPISGHTVPTRGSTARVSNRCRAAGGVSKASDDSEQVLKVGEVAFARRHQARADWIAADRLAEAVPKAPSVTHREIDPYRDTQREARRDDLAFRPCRAVRPRLAPVRS